ncbi:Histone acetyltransferase protein [Rutstroemia sp. NJR-2017a WRK4]|nr:Histone acetyltransferase protein [Rutstroemia sp. NJR-2017a WRK4]
MWRNARLHARLKLIEKQKGSKMDQTTSRLRKTFRYPTDNDSDDSLPDALDEEGTATPPSLPPLQLTFPQEQDSLIRTLHTQNTITNTHYTRLLLSLPLICILPYLRTLLHPRTSLLSILSISSLLSTSYLLYILPPGFTGISILDSLNSKTQSKTQAHLPVLSSDGPLQTYLPYLNIALSAILGVLGSLVKAKIQAQGMVLWTGFEWVPGGIYAVVIVAKLVMGSVDPEEELRGLRYGYKGA